MLRRNIKLHTAPDRVFQNQNSANSKAKTSQFTFLYTSGLTVMVRRMGYTFTFDHATAPVPETANPEVSFFSRIK